MPAIAVWEMRKKFQKILNEIKERYQEIIDGLHLSLSLEEDFSLVEENFKKQIGEEYAASRGEYLNGKIMAAYLGFTFVDPAEMIRFDGNGQFDGEITEKLLPRNWAVWNAQWYRDSTEPKKMELLRPFPEAALTLQVLSWQGAIDADLYENWTDVSGFLVTDPRIIDNPKPIDTITYRELRELSYMGATVHHEDAIFPVRKAASLLTSGIPMRPEDPGTMIVEDTCKKPPYTITVLQARKGSALYILKKSMMNSEIGFGRKVLQVLEEQGIAFEHIPSGIDTMTIYIHQG